MRGTGVAGELDLFPRWWSACCAEEAFGPEPEDGFAGCGGFGGFFAGMRCAGLAEGDVGASADGDSGGEGMEAELVGLVDGLGVVCALGVL